MFKCALSDQLLVKIIFFNYAKLQFLISWKYQDLDNDLRRSRNELKEFERQNLKDREDFSHLKKKIKKLDDKLERV